MGQLGGGALGFYGESVGGLFVVPLPFTFDLECNNKRYILLFSDVLSGQCRLSEIFPSQFPIFIFSFSTSLLFFVTVLSHVPYVRSSHLFEVFPFILPFSFLFILCHSFKSYSPCIMPSIPLTRGGQITRPHPIRSDPTRKILGSDRIGL